MAEMNDAAALSALLGLYSDFVSLMQEAMAAEERMHRSSLEAQQGLLTTALKGAENVSPEAFAVLVTALKEVSLASIEAQKGVALAQVENGKQAIKMMDNALKSAIEVGGQLGTVRLQQLERRVAAEEKRAEAKATAAAAEKLKAEKIRKDFKASA